MAKHFQREIERLKKQILTLGTYVEESCQKAIQSFEEGNEELAKEVVISDRQIDLMEVEVEEECLKILALHQPVAIDLRFIIAALKINNDLERIGDLAVNIANQTQFVVKHKIRKSVVDFDLPMMADKTQTMVRRSLDSLINMDPSLARKVCLSDDQVDAMYRNLLRIVEEGIGKDPDRMDLLIHYLQVARNLERISDQATNIAEDVIYMVEGEIVRHRLKEFNRAKGEKSPGPFL